jgi:hypothetical protein
MLATWTFANWLETKLRCGLKRTLTFCQWEMSGRDACGQGRGEWPRPRRTWTTVDASIQATSVGLMTITEYHYNTRRCFVTDVSSQSSNRRCSLYLNAEIILWVDKYVRVAYRSIFVWQSDENIMTGCVYAALKRHRWHVHKTWGSFP